MTVLEHWFEEVWNKGKVEAIDQLWVSGKVANGLAVEPERFVRTKDEFKAFHKLFRTAFPDMHVTVEDTVTEGDKTVARLVVTGTNTGPGLTPLAPTGKPVRFTGICMARVKDGNVIESWNNFDFMSMYKQLE